MTRGLCIVRGAVAALGVAACTLAVLTVPSTAQFQDSGAFRTNLASVEPVALAFEGVDAGDSYSLGWTSAGDLYAWGNNAQGQLGIGVAGGSRLLPTPIEVSASGVVEAAAGTNVSIALTSDGGVFTWGNPDILPNTSSPTRVAFFDTLGDPVVGVDAGGFYYLAWTQSGRLYSWGESGSGRLGRGGASNSPPAPVTAQGLNLLTIVNASAGRFQGVAIISERSDVFAWGQSFGATSGATVLSGGPPPVGVAAGTNLLLIWDSAGGLFSSSGATASAVPGAPSTVAATLSTPASGASSLYAWDAAGSLFAWGRNDQGQLGLGVSGGTVASPTLVPLTAGSTVLDVGAGGDHALYVGGDSTFSSAGANGLGQLGTGNTTPRNSFASGVPIVTWP